MTLQITQPIFSKTEKIIRSPLFYVGDKYKLMPQLKQLFPKNIKNYIEPFVGGGSSFLNIQAKGYLLNDIDSNIIKLHNFLKQQANNPDKLFNKIFSLIDFYQLTCSLKNIVPPKIFKEQYKKTYFAKYNKDFYLKLRDDFNANQNDTLRLYLLLIYGFNHMIRFNAKGNFNLPVGNVDFNMNVFSAIKDYLDFISEHKITFFNHDYAKFLQNIKFDKEDFIYCDPPYLISGSEYNKLWNEISEIEFYKILEELDAKGIRWGITNLMRHKNKTNHILERFSQKYKTFVIKSNYISFHDNTIKKDSLEVYITNVKNQKP